MEKDKLLQAPEDYPLYQYYNYAFVIFAIFPWVFVLPYVGDYLLISWMGLMTWGMIHHRESSSVFIHNKTNPM